MIGVKKISHATYETPDLDQQIEYYTDVLGLTLTAREKDAAFLASTLDHHSVVLRKGGSSQCVRLGFQVALDDFGAGLGSFSSLRALPIDYVKIDGEFVRGLARSPVDREIVKAIVALARAAGRRTIAEFVADQETLDLLTEIGVDLAQGFHIGRPRPLEELL